MTEKKVREEGFKNVNIYREQRAFDMKKYVFLLFLKDFFMQLREYTVAFGDSVVKAVLYFSMTKKMLS